ncbi:hypothetical protein GJU39_01840 [Pedobacter petrophilus]|uniref:Uncharacterized protein n=1 Tax=Pedobacter petrophilus TaxID=1908241 RepID=A0A7K0FT72_9SPHI|nr:hypothetical protein [Pedobacter petrophilus]MRX74817.1 hypothetical protein [Pedobacter petrophilus]
MQPIQDKNFDQLFKDRFEEAEITPSRDLWSNIESEIEPKKKRIIPIYWLSAAAVLLIATVGVLIYQQQKSAPKQYANNISPKREKPVIVEPQIKDTLGSAVAAPVKAAVKTLPVDAKPVTTLAKTKVEENVKRIEKQKVMSAPDIQKQETMIAKADEPKKDIKAKIEEAVFQTKQESVLASNVNEVVADEVIDNSYPAERKGIRNVGDVVNLIVNTMDKRKDKLIQFRTDDDDSSISVVNIGPFRIGKKSKK